MTAVTRTDEGLKLETSALTLLTVANLYINSVYNTEVPCYTLPSAQVSLLHPLTPPPHTHTHAHTHAIPQFLEKFTLFINSVMSSAYRNDFMQERVGVGELVRCQLDRDPSSLTSHRLSRKRISKLLVFLSAERDPDL